jgi:hypothetical protein
MGLTNLRLKIGDTLFFYQLVLTAMCDLAQSGIHGDPRRAFYSKVKGFTKFHAYFIGYGASYGHKFKPVDLDTIVHFGGVVVKDWVPAWFNQPIKQACKDCGQR